jgi:hypothetical protein
VGPWGLHLLHLLHPRSLQQNHWEVIQGLVLLLLLVVVVRLLHPLLLLLLLRVVMLVP